MREVKPPKISSSRNKLSSKTNPLDTAANLAEKRLKAGIENSAPYNTLIGDVAGQLSEGFKGDNDFDSIASGFFQGIQNVTKFNKMFENDKKYQEYQKVLDYFQQVNNQKLQQQQYHDKLENAQEQLRPMALAYFGNQKKDPQTAFISGQQMWNKYKELTGEPGEFLGWTPLDQNIAMIKGNDGEVELLDIRPLLLGDQYTENQIAALDQDYLNKLQEERQRYDQEMALEDRKVRSGEALNRKRMDVYDAQINKLNPVEQQSVAASETPEDENIVPLEKMGKKFAEEWQKMAAKEISQVPLNRRALTTTKEMRKIFKKYPDIGSSFVNVLLNGGSIKGWLNVIGKKISDQGELAAAQELEKLSGDLNLATVLGMPAKAVTDILKNTITAAAPSGLTTLEAFEKVADSWDDRADYNIRRANLIEKDISQGNYRRNLEDALSNLQSPRPTQQMQTPVVPSQAKDDGSYTTEDENGEKIQLTPEEYRLLQNQL